MKNITSKGEKEVKQPSFSEELADPIPDTNQHEQSAKTPPKRLTGSSAVKDLEAKVLHMASKPGFRSKIDAHCLWCTYDPLDSGSWRQQVKNCVVLNCPLYSVRATTRGKT